jgi:hypothetical protein
MRHCPGLICLILLVAALPASAAAIPAITCHCFTDRSYDPARPTVADPYFLATAQNAFFAAAFGVDKKAVVLKKQQGVPAEHLWIAYWLAAQSGVNPAALLQDRTAKGSWRLVGTARSISARMPGSRVAAGLAANLTDERLADAVVDELLLRFRFHGGQELAALRTAGAGNQELILLGLLAAKSRQPATQLYLEIKGGRVSWGGLVQRARLNPADIQAEMARLTAAGSGVRNESTTRPRSVHHQTPWSGPESRA